MNKITYINDKIINFKEELQTWEDDLAGLDGKFRGETLKAEEAKLNKWIEEAKIDIKAYTLLLEKETVGIN